MDCSTRHKILFYIVIAVTVSLVYFFTNVEFDVLYPHNTATISNHYYVSYPSNYTFILDKTPTCKNTTPFLILMVPVAPSNVIARKAIRVTWGMRKIILGQLVETLFVLGLPSGHDAAEQQKKLVEENEKHQDIIQSSFLDSYNNLTIKTMVLLEWVAKHCINASYVLKIDSDILLNVQNLVKLLIDSNTAKTNYVTGLVWWHSPVIRNPHNKFYMPRVVIPEPEYPPYALGMAYVMSLDLPEKILKASSEIRPIYLEDAYVGMCLKHLGLTPTDPPEKNMFQINPRFSLRNCSLSQVIAVTTESLSQMLWYWNRILKGVHC